MLNTLWTRRQLITTQASAREPTPVAPLSAKAAADVFLVRARLADTDGRLRRMRQTVDDNRLL